MAKIFPSRLPSYILLDPMRRSEVTIYNLLRDFGDSWTILYSARWTGKPNESRPNPDGEADFIVMHPRHGILVLEAKGGLMAFNGHYWTQNGRELDKSPFDQAKYNKYAIKNEVNRVLRRDPRAYINEVFDGVIFPACVSPRSGLPQEAPHESIIDESHLPNLEQRIIEIMTYRQGPYFERTQLDRYINIVREAFARPVEFENPLCTKIADEERQIANLTEGQFKAVVRMRDFPRCSICGGAGTGKTLLAIKEALRLESLHRQVALICFNAPLADFLEQHAKGVSFVGTFRAFCERGLQDAKQKVGSGDVFEAYTRAQSDGLIKKFDAIVVDEGQDFEDIWWIALLDSIDNDGFLRVFFDDNQRVRKEGGSLPKELLPAVYLDDNVRNTRAVFDAFKGFYYSDNKVLPAGPVGRKVEWLSLTTPSELAAVLGKMIHQLASVNRVKASDIVVLTPKDPQNSRLSNLTLAGTYRLTHSPPTDPNQVRWETAANFKGLEASVVIVVEADHSFLKTPTAEAILYVAFSRPRSHLVVIGVDEDLKEIEKLAADL